MLAQAMIAYFFVLSGPISAHLYLSTTAKDAFAMLESDMTAGEELTRETFGRRPLLVRLLERLAYSFRKWL